MIGPDEIESVVSRRREQNPGAAPEQRALRDLVTPAGSESRSDEMIPRSRSLGGNQRERIDRRIKTIVLRREFGQAVDRCVGCKSATGRPTVGGRRQLGGWGKYHTSGIGT